MGLTKILAFAGIIGAMTFLPTKNYAQNSQINFEKETFKEIKEKAKDTNKLIFIDGYTTWCGPCKLMDRTVFVDDDVAKFYNENFINVKMDMETREGKKLDSIYDVKYYPTFLFIDDKGNLIHQSVGRLSSEEFVKLGEDALNPDKQLASLKEKYKNGERKGKFIYNYSKVLKNAALSYKDVLQDYFKTQKDKDLTSRENWKIIFLNKYRVDIDSREFKYVIENKEKFDEIYTSDSVDNNIFDAYNYNFRDVLYSESFNPENYEKWKEKVKQGGFSRLDEVLLESEMRYSKKIKDWDKYSSNAVSLIEIHKRNYNSDELNEISWYFFENVKNSDFLNKAVKWAKHSVELNSNADNNDTYASLLYVVGDTSLAIKIETKAIELAKKEGFQKKVDNMYEVLGKMKSGKNLY